MSRRIRTIKKPSKTGSVSLDDARAAAQVVRDLGTRTKTNAAFMKPLKPSATLAVVIGASSMPRTEVTKKIWSYIKRNGLLQQKKVGHVVVVQADNKLKPVFGGKSNVSMYEMTKLVNKHLK